MQHGKEQGDQDRVPGGGEGGGGGGGEKLREFKHDYIWI